MMYDTETVVAKLEELYKAKLNDVITCINTKKNDSIVMDTIADDLYSFETLSEDMLNYSGAFIMFGLVNTPPKEMQAGNFIKEVKTTFRIAFADQGNADRRDEFTKLLRYQLALETVILKNLDVLQGYSYPMVTSLLPEAMEFNGKIFLNIGINISASITAR